MELSIVIPAYNEAERLPLTLQRINAHFANDPRSYEIIVVDDGSTDGTGIVATQSALPVRLVQQPKNMGKGAAVRTGMAAAQGEWRYLCDADLSTPIEDFEKLWIRRHEADVILGSRRMPGSSIERHQRWWKEVLGQAGNAFIQLMVVRGIHDTQCGFKLFSRRTRSLFERQQLNSWGYDFEILWLARRAGLRLLEIPVRWVNDDRSKVRPSDYVKTLVDVLRIRYYQARGFYKLPI